MAGQPGEGLDERQAVIDELASRLGHEQTSANAALIARGAYDSAVEAATEAGYESTPELIGVASSLLTVKALVDAGELRGDLNSRDIIEALFDPSEPNESSLPRIVVGQVQEKIAIKEAAQNA